MPNAYLTSAPDAGVSRRSLLSRAPLFGLLALLPWRRSDAADPPRAVPVKAGDCPPLPPASVEELIARNGWQKGDIVETTDHGVVARYMVWWDSQALPTGPGTPFVTVSTGTPHLSLEAFRMPHDSLWVSGRSHQDIRFYGRRVTHDDVVALYRSGHRPDPAGGWTLVARMA